MTAGNQPTTVQINATVGGFATQLRSLFQGVQNFEAWLTAAGGATFLEAAPLSYSTADASTIGNLNTPRGHLRGRGPGRRGVQLRGQQQRPLGRPVSAPR
jgi:hypothetical protein